jgi:outer membrane receptor protein involved in Fe transport
MAPPFRPTMLPALLLAACPVVAAGPAASAEPANPLPTSAGPTDPEPTSATATRPGPGSPEPISLEPTRPEPGEIVVTARLRSEALRDVPASITVLERQVIELASLQHFEELTTLVPNLNWSGEGSRARYFQLRGIGELEQYEGAPNPSVGFIVDDIDLSAIGGAATLYDVEQVEVLRGPQGTRYGANALAGLIYVRSAAATTTPEFRVDATGGSDDTAALGLVAGGALPGTPLAGRLAIQQYRSDGFRDNAFSGRDDTNGRDELTLRGKLHWDAGAATTVDLTLLHVDLDNGYDAFAIDNGLTAYSDKPGQDAQRTTAAALRIGQALGSTAQLTSITSAAGSDIDFGFDADWGNDDFWAPVVYDFTQAFDRRRETFNQEFRLASLPDGQLAGFDWTVGAWWLHLAEDNDRADRGRYCDPGPCDPDSALDRDVTSHYRADNVALFGELSRELVAGTTLALGLRFENRYADYTDATTDRLAPGNPPPADFDATDRLWGGELTLRRAFTPDTSAYARIARGYKAGNVNPSLAGFSDADFPGINGRLQVDPEYLYNYELGADLTRDRWRARAAVFHQQRYDLQVRTPAQLVPGDPTTFVFFTDNAERGYSRGLEVEGSWQATTRLQLGAALGLLDTEVTRYNDRPELEGRDFAHAPSYTAALNATWRSEGGWFARVDATAKDRFYFDYCTVDFATEAADCDFPRSRAYQVVDARVGRERGPWRIELWARNVFDERYAVRGFFFGNEPPDFANQTYVRLGDPRHVGVTLSYRLPGAN